MSQGYKEGNELALSVKRHHPNHQSLEQLSPNHHQNHYYQINDIRDACSLIYGGKIAKTWLVWT